MPEENLLARPVADDGTEGTIEVVGARVNNLKNIDVSIPHRSLTVVTGLDRKSVV